MEEHIYNASFQSDYAPGVPKNYKELVSLNDPTLYSFWGHLGHSLIVRRHCRCVPPCSLDSKSHLWLCSHRSDHLEYDSLRR